MTLPFRLAAALLATGLPVLALLLPSATATRQEKKPATLTLAKGDRIALVGNTLAERMQHDGWLDAYLHSRFPEHDLAFRNLGFSGDELTHRIRSMAFGSPDDWLTRVKADVVFAFFGYNESFKDKAGLDGFKKDLAGYLTHLQGKKYNGKSAPRVVLFSPIAHEDLKDPNLPDGKDNNRRLKLYTSAMAEVAAAHKVPFVDLFTPTAALYARGKGPYTINGVHLTEKGNEEVAKIIDAALFPAEAQPRNDKALAKLREAVLDRNFHWFHRYRTVDGYSTYGARADLVFAPDRQTNREVMQRELEVLDDMTANRDARVWAVARGKDLKVDDSNTPPFVEVKTNKPGPLPGGKHVFLDGEKAIEKMTIAKGLKVKLFASEKKFPQLVNPVQMSFDPRGRLWVAVWPSYPHWKPKEKMDDKILILEDTDGDGVADTCETFADGLHCPTGFEFWNGGVLVAQAPDLWFLKDTKGTGKADLRRRVVHGLCSADTHHAANSFVLDPGGALYFQEGTFHHSQSETPYGPTVRLANAGVFRYEPRAQKFDVYVTYGFANPHGHVFDRWGQDIVIDGTGSQPYHAVLFSGRLEYPEKHRGTPTVWRPPTRPCPGMEVMSSRHFPAEWQGDLLVGNVIGMQGILRFKLQDDGGSFAGRQQADLLSSSDPNFRPSDLRIGPDGALYFIDWHNPIIGHMQHNLRDPSRDREHGRIYKVTHEGRQLLTPAKIAGQPIDKLLELLKEPEDRTRYRTRIELTGRKTEDVLAAARAWVAKLDPKSATYEHELLEALWLHQSHNVVNEALLKQLLEAKDFRARAAATRVLCYWRDRVKGSLDLLKKRAGDDSPRVRLEAVRAASFYTVPEAVEVVLIAGERPSDKYSDYLRGETMRALQPYVRKAIAEGTRIPFTTPAGARYFLRTVSTDDLLKMERTQAVYLELLFRKGVRDEYRAEALAGLAKLEKKAPLAVLLAAIRSHDEQSRGEDDDSIAFDLARLLTGRGATELAAARGELVKLATASAQPVTRQLGFVALVAADGGSDKAWAVAIKSTRSLHDFVAAVPLIRDGSHRADAYPRVAALLDGLPKELAGQAGKPGVRGRYVRVELPGRLRTLTLAEVEVYSEGVNVARKGKASQRNTAFGGDASRGIDGNTSGAFEDGGQTHSAEGTNNPWWEVDLGKEVPIESIVIYNRTDGNLGNRLNNYTLKVLDGGRQVAWSKERNPVPEPKATFTLGSGSPDKIARRLAMQALPTMRGKEADAVKALVKFLKDEGDRPAAVAALGRIPTAQWPAEQAAPVMSALLAYVRKVPVKERTAAPVTDALQLADAVAALLPPAAAKKARAELGELGVRVIRLGTLVEQMLYDKERIVVQAGKPFEIVFENTDTMPHNFALIEPGSLEEIGELGEKTATDPKASARHYIPASKKVLLSSKLLQPRQTERLSFTAPTKPGVYPYVCTYPGHWRRMHGALYVVEDLDAYLAGPEAYLKKHPVKIADPLLASNRPRTEWKFDELEPLVKELRGRSFANGKQMFTVGTCVSCHKFGGAGQEFGPDLTKLDPKWTAADVLKHTLDPSLKIDDKYRSWTFTLSSGRVVTGIILKETKEVVEVVENPLVSAKPTVIKVSSIESRKKSETSQMPKGLLDKLTREEVLDLMAYVFSGANAKHRAFGAEGHGHGHGH